MELHQEKLSEKDIQKINKISDYDSIFRDTKREKNQDRKIMNKLLIKHIPSIFVSLLFFIIKHSPTFIIPVVSSIVIDEVRLGDNADIHKIVILAIILFISIMQNVPTHMIYSNISNNLLRTISANIKATVIRKLQRLSITYHKEIESGRLQSKFLKDTDNIEAYLRVFIANLLPSVVGLLICIGIALYQSPIIVLFYIVIVPINVSLTRIFRKPMKTANRDFRKETENLSQRLSQMLEMLQVTKAHGLEEEEISSLDKNIISLTKKGLIVDKTNAYFGSIVWVVSQLFGCICLFFSAFMAIKGVPGFTIGSIFLYQSMFNQINSYIQILLNFMPQISAGKEALRSVSEIMNSDDIENNSGKINLKKVSGNIDFNNVCYHYPDSKDNVIKNFNLHIKSGECIAFVGDSGSGKSTIMNMIIGFLIPTVGELSIDGKNISDIDLSLYRQSISVVPQNSILFDGTIKDNITYGLKKYSDDDLQKVIQMANISEFLPELKDGLNTNIGEHGGKLSGGQKQRITIARALIRNPNILILDEATSALDNISEYHVQKAIEQSIKGRTTLIVAHRLSTIRNADRIVVMQSGAIIEAGTYDELMSKKGKFYELKNLSDIETKDIENI